MNATCYILDPAKVGPSGWDPESGTATAPDETPALVLGSLAFPIPCRIVDRERDEATEQAGQESTRKGYLVQIHDPELALPAVLERHELVVVSALNDVALAGERFRVTGSVLGSERFVRDVFVEDNQQEAVA